MPANDTKRPDHESLRSPKVFGRRDDHDLQGLKPGLKKPTGEEILDPSSLKNPLNKPPARHRFTENRKADSSTGKAPHFGSQKPDGAQFPGSGNLNSLSADIEDLGAELSYSELVRVKRQEKRSRQDADLLNRDTWIIRHGHSLTYFGLYIFSFLVFFRPYEIVPGLGFLAATAFYVALATLAIYIPTQLATEGNLTVMSTEVKCAIGLIVFGLLTIVIAKSPALAWETFNDNFIKAVVMFIVMVNVLRTRNRLMGLVWLSLLIAVYLSFSAWSRFLAGDFIEGADRATADISGMFGNPNDLALHLVMMTPIALTLGLAHKNLILKAALLGMAGFFMLANMVTFSRGGFLGLLAALGTLAWKLGRKHRLNVTLASIGVGGLTLLLAPGNYGMRILSIFVPGLDPTGSRGQRSDLLWQSLLVTARNPWGIGMGNFNIVSIRNLASHNAYTQVSTELGILGLLTYLVFIFSPLRKLSAIERTLFAKGTTDWFYYLSIGFQASIVGFMVSSFFVSVAYNWFAYYLIAYAVAFRRIYRIEQPTESVTNSGPLSKHSFTRQTA